MSRALAILAIFALTAISAASVAHRDARPAGACTIAFATFDQRVAGASFIGVVRADAVGDAMNRAPALTSTATPPETATPGPTSTATMTGGLAASYPSLQGRGAEVSVIRTLHGSVEGSSFSLDRAARESYERDLRTIEAGRRPLCGPFPPVYYEEGSTYVLLTWTSGGEIYTFARFKIDGDQVIIDDGSAGENRATLTVSASLYRRYLSQYEAVVQGEDQYESATITAPRMSLVDLIAAIDAMRNPQTITAPNTGSAGLADPRLGLR